VLTSISNFLRDSYRASSLQRLIPLLLVLVALGMAGACGEQNESAPIGPSPLPGPAEPIVYTALGASDAIGVGASVSCVPFTPCPDGTGYVQIIARQLGATRQVTLTNLGIPTAVLSPSIQKIGNAYGRGIAGNLLDQQMRFVPTGSHLVSIFAGGNDTNAIATAVEAGAGGGDPIAYMNAQIRGFGTDYGTLIQGVRQRAPSARIVVANLPNFAGLPFTAGYSLGSKRVMQHISIGFAREISRFASQGVAVVDLLCDPRSYNPGHYSADGFHPSDAGYAFFAAEMLSAMTSPTYPSPQASCPPMTLVPSF
jgi:lysophospholipase L1-like esterase